MLLFSVVVIKQRRGEATPHKLEGPRAGRRG